MTKTATKTAQKMESILLDVDDIKTLQLRATNAFPDRNRTIDAIIMTAYDYNQGARIADQIIRSSPREGALVGDTFLKMNALLCKLHRFGKLNACAHCGREVDSYAVTWPLANVLAYDAMTFRPMIGHEFVTVDHIIPQRWGGTDHASNLQCTCERCNHTKGAAITDQDIETVRDHWDTVINLNKFVSGVSPVFKNYEAAKAGGHNLDGIQRQITSVRKLVTALFESNIKVSDYIQNQKGK